MKKILFLTGTRADYGKLKPLMENVDQHSGFECGVFITGMHMLAKYGSTYMEIEKDGYKNLYKFINQTSIETMDVILSNTVLGFSNYIKEYTPDLIVIHGDRLEALAGAIVGAFNNILVAHIEGGEVSGTIDDSIRHSITKLAHLHFVANDDAEKRVMQLGEKKKSIYIIGSPDIDVMLSPNLPIIDEVKKRYDIPFNSFSIFIYHPVTTDLKNLDKNIKESIDALIESGENFVVIYPNNDEGTKVILNEFKRLENNLHFKVYPSIRFEYFLTLLKNCRSVIGNSSIGIREAEVYGIPTVNIGDRQNNRSSGGNIVNCHDNKKDILLSMRKAANMVVGAKTTFGSGNSAESFMKVIESEEMWNSPQQKIFIDIGNG